MAKINTRNATKLADASYDVNCEDRESFALPLIDGVGGLVRRFFVLRSDGWILKASSFPNHPAGSYDRRKSAYTQWKRFNEEVRNGDQQEMVDRFLNRVADMSVRANAVAFNRTPLDPS